MTYRYQGHVAGKSFEGTAETYQDACKAIPVSVLDQRPHTYQVTDAAGRVVLSATNETDPLNLFS